VNELVDARGVALKPGATVVYGFGVGRSIAMAEGLIESKAGEVALTPSGRVWVQVVRRTYSSGEKSRVHVQADHLVVVDALPASPQPTQLEGNITKWLESRARYRSRLAALGEGGPLESWEVRYPREEVIEDYGKWLVDVEKRLKGAGQ
jgi:hypothetical protein